MKTHLFGTLFTITVITLTLSGFVWFFINRYVYKYHGVSKAVFWYFMRGFVLMIAMAILSMAG